MSDPQSDKPERRPRYRGRHPRNFHEKYKEHQPDRYSDDVAKVVASGKTPAGTHRPIMVQEIMSVLAVRPGDHAIDCTLGYGGHAREILSALQPNGCLLALDVDPIELPKAEKRLMDLGYSPASLVVRRSNFAGLSRVAEEVMPGGADVILADLGISSMQYDDPERGFTFKADAPLDMRMNPTHGQSAAALLSKLDETKLIKLLTENSDEPRATRLAKAILEKQHRNPIQTTGALAEIIRDSLANSTLPIDEVKLTIRRVFQALRIAVNDEFGALDALLRQLPFCLRSGGRVAILTFHSGEDRRVKHAFKQGLIDEIYASVSENVIRPTVDEQRANSRSASAKLRFAVRK